LTEEKSAFQWRPVEAAFHSLKEAPCTKQVMSALEYSHEYRMDRSELSLLLQNAERAERNYSVTPWELAIVRTLGHFDKYLYR
jgi:hypothetical protein